MMKSVLDKMQYLFLSVRRVVTSHFCHCGVEVIMMCLKGPLVMFFISFGPFLRENKGIMERLECDKILVTPAHSQGLLPLIFSVRVRFSRLSNISFCEL